MSILGLYGDRSSSDSMKQPLSTTSSTLPNYDSQSFTDEDEDDYELLLLENQWLQESGNRFETLPWYYRPSKKLLCAILALHTLSFTTLMGPLMIIMMENICSTSDSPNCKSKTGQYTLSNIQSILSLISGLLGFSVSGIFGQWSDSHGRVFVFKWFSLINIGYIIGLFMYFRWFAKFNGLLMVITLSIGYLNGGVMTSIANGNSYLSDIVTVEERTTAISHMMAVIYTMLGTGPLLGSFVIHWAQGNNSIVLNWSLGFGIATLVLTFGFMTETRHPKAMERARQLYTELPKSHSGTPLEGFQGKMKSLFHPIKRVWLPPSVTGSLLPRRNVLCLVLIDVLVMCSTVGTVHTVILYTISQYQWSSVEVGYYMSLTGFGKAIVLLIVAPCMMWVVKDKTNWKIQYNTLDEIDKKMIAVSTLMVVMSCLCINAWKSPVGVYASAVLQSLAGVMSPTIQSAVIKYSSKTTSGEMFGAIALLRHLAMLIAPVCFLQLYKLTLNTWTSCFLFIALVCGLLAFALSTWGLKTEEVVVDGP